jgi:hypothetical protein
LLLALYTVPTCIPSRAPACAHAPRSPYLVFSWAFFRRLWT